MGKTITLGEKTLALDLQNCRTFEEWVELGKNLASANKVLQWWIGDWWAAGSHRYGERAKLAAEGIFGREFQSLRNVASVCRSFETSRRRDTLSFGHHEAVASLEPVQADGLLERAERDNWSVRDIRAEASSIRAASSSVPRRDINGETVEWSALVGAWNRARISVRERFLSEVSGTSAIE